MKRRKSTGSKAVVTEAVNEMEEPDGLYPEVVGGDMQIPAGLASSSSSQPPVEIIIKVGGEGFSWTLLGRKKPPTGEWEFATECDESSLKGMLAEEDETGLPYYTKTG